jgi:uncharacterized protein (TIRG00374 family)
VSTNLVVRFRKWVIISIAFGAALYLGGAVWVGVDKVGDALVNFQWWILIPVCLLTLLNYSLRFVKWHYLLRKLGVDMPIVDNAWNFASGLAMVISPGKVGELLKPYVVRERCGAPMATTTSALVTERLTDGIAMLILASVGVANYAQDKAHYLYIPGVLTIAGLLVLSHKGLSMWSIRLLGRMPGLTNLSHKLEEMMVAMRTCVAPAPLALTIIISVVAWGAECLGFLLVFKGFGVDASLDVCVFLYAFATVAGGAMPGGLGVADGALAGGALALISGLTEPVSVAAALLIRICTLWIGVAIGAAALIKVSSMLGGNIALDNSALDAGE